MVWLSSTSNTVRFTGTPSLAWIHSFSRFLPFRYSQWPVFAVTTEH